MKELTAQRLIKILLEQNSGLKAIESQDIARVKRGLMDKPIRASLASADFREVSCTYPAFVSVTETSITIQDGRHFKQILERRLIYSKDSELEQTVIKVWKRRNEY